MIHTINVEGFSRQVNERTIQEFLNGNKLSMLKVWFPQVQTISEYWISSPNPGLDGIRGYFSNTRKL